MKGFNPKKILSLFLALKENDYQAKFLRPNFLFSFVFLFFFLRVIVLPLYFHFPQTTFFAQIVSSEIIDLLNNERTEMGLGSLRLNPLLNEAAALKARDMLERDYFGHRSPNGISGWYWIKKVGYNYQLAGENLAIGFLDSSEVHEAWNNSSMHRRNLLDPRFEEIGVAVLNGEFQGNQTTVIVQLFATPVKQPSVTSLPASNQTTKQEQPEQLSEQVVASEQELVQEPVEQTSEQPRFVEEGTTQVSVPMPKQEVSGVVKEKQSLSFNVWQFFIRTYNKLVQRVILMAAGFLFSTALVNSILILRLSLGFKQKLLVLRNYIPSVLLSIVILLFLGFTDKALVIQLIPHSLKI
jgi:hypothetical protein